MGGWWFQELFGDPDEIEESKLIEIGCSALSEQLGIHQDPTYCKVIIQKVFFLIQSIVIYRCMHSVELVHNENTDILYIGLLW